MKINFELAKWSMDSDGLWLSIKIPENMKETAQEFVANLQNNPKKHVAEIKQYRKKRSLDANGYMWVILRAMAEKLMTTDKEIYREMIRRVGQADILPVRDDAIEAFTKRWEAHGIGYQVDNLGPCKNTEGYSNLRCYYGSSVYDSREFSILLDEIITEAKALGIETATPEEIERMKQQYERR